MTQTQLDYAKVVTDLYAACLTASEATDDALVNAAIAAINEDDLVRDKSAALQTLSAAVESLIGERQRSAMLHRLKVSAIVAAPAGLANELPLSAVRSGMLAIRDTAERLGSSATVAIVDAALPHLQRATALTPVAPAEPLVEVVIRTSAPASPEPDYIAAQLRLDAELSLGEYIRACGITAITSDKIFFAPNIPAKKLQGAGASLAGRVLQQDIVVLVDDTVFGGAKEGIFITEQALFIKEAFVPLASHPLGKIRSIRAENNVLYINGDRVIGLNMPDKRETGYLFWEVSNWLEARARHPAADGIPTLPKWLEAAAVDAICRGFQTPELRVEGETMAPGMTAGKPDRVPSRTPCYYVGGDIRNDVVRLLRFGFAMAADEAIVAFSDMATGDHSNPNKAFVVTTAGLRCRCVESQPAVFVSWDELVHLEVVTEFNESIYTGVALSDGRRLHTGGLNSVVRPLGGRLVGALIGYASEHGRTNARSGAGDRTESGSKAGQRRPEADEEAAFRALRDGIFDVLAEHEREFIAEAEKATMRELFSLVVVICEITGALPAFCDRHGYRLSRSERRLAASDAIRFEVALYLISLVKFLARRSGLSQDSVHSVTSLLYFDLIGHYKIYLEAWLAHGSMEKLPGISATPEDSEFMASARDVVNAYYTCLSVIDDSEASEQVRDEIRGHIPVMLADRLREPYVFKALQDDAVAMMNGRCKKLFTEELVRRFMLEAGDEAAEALDHFIESTDV